MDKVKQREWYLDKPEEFWIHGYDYFYQMEGKPIGLPECPEADLFVVHYTESDEYTVTDGPSGFDVCYAGSPCAKSEEEAIQLSRSFIAQVGLQQLQILRAKAIQRHGLSPRYAYYPDEEEPCD